MPYAREQAAKALRATTTMATYAREEAYDPRMDRHALRIEDDPYGARAHHRHHQRRRGVSPVIVLVLVLCAAAALAVAIAALVIAVQERDRADDLQDEIDALTTGATTAAPTTTTTTTTSTTAPLTTAAPPTTEAVPTTGTTGPSTGSTGGSSTFKRSLHEEAVSTDNGKGGRGVASKRAKRSAETTTGFDFGPETPFTKRNDAERGRRPRRQPRT